MGAWRLLRPKDKSAVRTANNAYDSTKAGSTYYITDVGLSKATYIVYIMVIVFDTTQLVRQLYRVTSYYDLLAQHGVQKKYFMVNVYEQVTNKAWILLRIIRRQICKLPNKGCHRRKPDFELSTNHGVTISARRERTKRALSPKPHFYPLLYSSLFTIIIYILKLSTRHFGSRPVQVFMARNTPKWGLSDISQSYPTCNYAVRNKSIIKYLLRLFICRITGCTFIYLNLYRRVV